MGLLLQNGNMIGGLSTEFVDKIGNSTLTTTAPDLSGAVNELNTGVTNASKTVRQVESNTNGDYPVLFSGDNSYNVNAYIGETKRDIYGMTYNPYANLLTVGSTSEYLYTTIKPTEIKITEAIDGTKSLTATKDDLTLAGTTWDGTNTSLKTAVGAKVSKSGDTMTGNLEAQDFIAKGSIKSRTGADLVQSNNGVTSNVYKYITFIDKNSKSSGYIENAVLTSGTVNGGITIRNYKTNGTDVNNQLILYVTKEGARQVTVSDGAIWRSAIGAAAASSRLTKENIKDMTEDEAKKILDIDLVSFQYKDAFIHESETKHTCYGVIAEDVLGKIPFVVNVPEDYDESKFDESLGLQQRILTIDYDKFVPYILKVLQMQQKEINKLKGK